MHRPAILMYHHVHAASAEEGVVHRDSYLDAAMFTSHLDWLRRHRWSAVTLAEALTAPHTPRRSVVITFDDACVCFRDVVAPALLERSQRATVFAVSGELGGTNRWDHAAGERRETLLGAGDLKRLAEQGMEIGCHGKSHADLTRVADLSAEVAGAKADLEVAIEREVRTFCYPYGALDERVRRAVQEAGFAGAASIFGHPGASTGDRFALPRMIIRHGESTFELALKVRGLYPLWSRLPRLGLLRSLRNRSAPSTSRST